MRRSLHSLHSLATLITLDYVLRKGTQSSAGDVSASAASPVPTVTVAIADKDADVQCAMAVVESDTSTAAPPHTTVRGMMRLSVATDVADRAGSNARQRGPLGSTNSRSWTSSGDV